MDFGKEWLEFFQSNVQIFFSASIFIAGSSGDMPKAVTGAIHEICQKDVQTEEIAAKLEKEGRLQFETWS